MSLKHINQTLVEPTSLRTHCLRDTALTRFRQLRLRDKEPGACRRGQAPSRKAVGTNRAHRPPIPTLGLKKPRANTAQSSHPTLPGSLQVLEIANHSLGRCKSEMALPKGCSSGSGHHPLRRKHVRPKRGLLRLGEFRGGCRDVEWLQRELPRGAAPGTDTRPARREAGPEAGTLRERAGRGGWGSESQTPARPGGRFRPWKAGKGERSMVRAADG